MNALLLSLSFIFLGIISPVFLIAIAAPWPFANILTAWSLFAVIAYPLLWLAMGKKQLM
jgi:hypothetical protein